MQRLILRLSSLGDLILATSALEALPSGEKCDWLTSKEYREFLQTHPKINRLLEFDRKSGLSHWIQLCRQIWESHYDEIYDLHRTLRTRMMRILFYFWSLKEWRALPRWRSVSKQRWRLYAYFLFKGLWPRKLRPTPWVKKFSQVIPSGKAPIVGMGPNLSYLLLQEQFPSELQEFLKEGRARFLCVMPSSRWPGKNWLTSRYVEVLRELPFPAVILGSQSDVASRDLCLALEQAGISHFNGIGRWNLRQTAHVLKNSLGYLGSDTGLSHLAESLNVPAHVIFGPTTPGIGFGPRLPQSNAIESSIWCRPCGKDGRHCFRVTARYACQSEISSSQVLSSLTKKSSC